VTVFSSTDYYKVWTLYIQIMSNTQHENPASTFVFAPNQILLTLWIRVLPEKLTDPQLVNKFPAFYEMLITAFTTASHFFLS